MRVLVVGTVPPPGGPSARRLARVAAARLALGDTVTVLSPDPRSAAHRSASLSSFGLVAQLAWESRRHDALELRIEPSLPFSPESTRVSRAALLLGLGAVLSRFEEVTLRTDSPVPIPGGVGGRATSALWRAVDKVIVANEEDRALFLAVPELSPEQVVVEAPDSFSAAPAAPQWPSATEPMLREEVQGAIRRAATDEAALRAARRELGAPVVESQSALSASGRVRPSLQTLAEAAAGLTRQRVVRVVRRQWAAIGTGSRSR